MKNFTYIAALVMMVFIVACKTDVEEVTLLPHDKVVAPVIKECADVVINPDNLKEEVVFSWDKADFGQPVQVQYLVNLMYGNKTARLGASFDTSITISKEELGSLAREELGMPENTKNDATLWIDAELYNGTGVYPPVSSERRKLAVTISVSMN